MSSSGGASWLRIVAVSFALALACGAVMFLQTRLVGPTLGVVALLTVVLTPIIGIGNRKATRGG